MNNNYIYFHINLVSNEVFYVGKGKDKRAWSNARRSKYWDNVVNKYGYRVDIIHENLSEKRAFDWEKLYISMFGRKDLGLGTLVNHTNGGEGASGAIRSEEFRKNASEKNKGINTWQKGRKHTEETKKKLSGKNPWNKGIPMNEETKKKCSDSNKGQIQSEEARRKNSEWHKGKKLSEETKKKMSKPKSDEHRKKIGDAVRLRLQNKKNQLQLITE